VTPSVHIAETRGQSIISISYGARREDNHRLLTTARVQVLATAGINIIFVIPFLFEICTS
jgi:hypothetical protein